MAATRRELLRAATAATALLPFTGLRNLAFAANESRDPILVFVFLRGGCDVLHFVGPVNDAAYIEARAPDLRVLDSGDRAGLALENGPQGVDFRLHPEALPLLDLYRERHLAIVHATGLIDETRSHFVAQDLVERGWFDGPAAQRARGGWMARWLQMQTSGSARGSNIVTAVSANGAVAKSFDGDADILAVPNLKNGYGIAGGDEAANVLQALYQDGRSPVATRGRAALTATRALDARLPRGADHKPIPYQPAHGAAYEENVDGGAGFAAIAQLLKLDVGLRAATLDIGGWDTHENQPGRFAGNLRNFARNLGAFWNDTARFHDRLTLVVTTEFGRRLRSNKSNGTDHGHGSMTLVLGGGMAGGRVLGNWPGLATEALDRGVDLAVTTDFRTVLAEALAMDPATRARVFPGLANNSALGLHA